MFTTCLYTSEMDSAPKNHTETTLEVLFLKNAYCILSMAINLFLDSTDQKHAYTPNCSRTACNL